MINMKRASVIIILVVLFFSIFIGYIGITAYSFPGEKSLKTVSGIISKYNHRDKKPLDFILDVRGDYFNVTLEDGSIYSATGICHEEIDHELFKRIEVGEEITLIYNDKNRWLSSVGIVSIEYQGTCYLDLDTVRKEFEGMQKPTKITCFSIIGIIIISTAVFFMMIEKKNKRRI